MSSGERGNDHASRLIERLLVDPDFRAEFRRNPVAASEAAGLPELAAELAGTGRPMDTLVVRESRSSLAGVVMAVAVEGMSVAEAQALMQHGVTGLPHGKLPHGVVPSHLAHGGALRNPLAHVQHAATPAALQRELRHDLPAGGPAHAGGGAASAAPAAGVMHSAGAAQSSGVAHEDAQGGGAGGRAGGSAPAYPSAQSPPTPAPEPAPVPATDAPSGAAAPPTGAPTAPATGASAPGARPATPEPPNPGALPATPEPTPPNPGAQPIDGGAVPAWPDQQMGGSAGGGVAIGSGAVGASGGLGGLAALLESPRLAAPPNVRTFLASGAVDPRMVSVLDSALANHTIGLGQVVALSDPVHVQAVDIVSVDGQSVGPDNLAARDLVTEIAALDPSQRPSEIGTPWPIRSQGFFSDAGSANRLHLAFEMPGTDSPPAGAGTQAADVMTSPAAGQVAYPAPVGGQVASPEVQVVAGQPAAGALGSMQPESVPLSSVVPAPMAAATPGSGADAALAYARAMIGKLPESAGSNLGPQLDKFESDFGFHGAPWCGIFAGHVMEAAGLKVPHSVASVASILDLARNGDPPFVKGVLPLSEARPGDLATFGGTEHVAVITKIDAAGVHTIAGNTGQSNVSESIYSPGAVTGVVRPDYGAGTPGSIPGVWDHSGAQAPAAGGAAAPAVGPVGHYVSPLPADARIGRTDMGVDVDLNPGDPIVAPGTSRVLGVMPNWYQGQPYVALQLLDGPMQGHNYYIAEQFTPDVSVGQVVQQGQPIGHFASSGTGVEMGWAGPGGNWEQTLAQATGHDNADMGDHANTPAGISFRNFLESTGSGDSSPGAGSGAADSIAVAPAPVAPEAAPVAPEAAAAVPPAAGAAVPPAAAAAVPPAAAAAVPAVPPQPGAAAFNAPGSGHRSFGRHTVRFLPAVQPSPGSPLYGQAPGLAAAPQAAVPEAAVPQAAVPQEVVPEASAGAAQPVEPPAAGQPGPADVLEQAPAPAGGSISVSSSLLTAGQGKFAGRLAELTGLDPRVVAAWELAEESGSAAQGREAASNFNWLNIGYFDSGAGKIAFDKEFGDPVSAAEQTAKFLKGEWGGASSSIRAILSTVGHGPDEQMAAIANSDWASSHYGGGANLHGTFNELGDIHIENTAVA